MVESVLAVCEVERTPEQTTYDLRLDDTARMLAVFPPTASHGPCLVIRKFVRVNLTWEKLIEFDCITAEAKAMLKSAVQAHRNILVAGGAGAGKTTVANLLAELIDPAERLVIVESFHELNIRMNVQHPRAVYLEAKEHGDISLQELITIASKMRPDWLVVGELFGPEFMRVLEIFGHGHWGITMLHAGGPEDALARLEAACLMANLGLGLHEIRSLITSALQLITYQQMLPSGIRKITHVIELSGLENDRYVLQPLFRYNPETDHLEATGIRPSWGV